MLLNDSFVVHQVHGRGGWTEGFHLSSQFLVNVEGAVIESGKTTMTVPPTPPEKFRPNPKLKLREQELWEPWEKIVARAFEIQERKIRRLK